MGGVDSSSSDSRVFGYSVRPESELAFYVVCSDQMILDNINTLLKGRGLLGISDTAGRMHYMVDARRSVRAAAQRIAGETDRRLEVSSLSHAAVLDIVDRVIREHHLGEDLLGTRLLRYMLVQSITEPALLTAITKRLYPLAAKEFGLSVSKIERNLRYAIGKSDLASVKGRRMHIISQLHNRVRSMLAMLYDCMPYGSEDALETYLPEGNGR